MNINEEFREKINLDELFTQQKVEHVNKKKVYQKILARIHKRIKYQSRLKQSDSYCFYLIPEFILGTPKYDIAACTAYLIKTLEENGFVVKYTYPNLLFISWKHYIPDFERQKYRKETGVKIDGFGNVIKRKKNKDPEDTNQLLLNDKGKQNAKKSALKNKNYKDVSSYKPSGGLIYSNDIIKKINLISE